MQLDPIIHYENWYISSESAKLSHPLDRSPFVSMSIRAVVTRESERHTNVEIIFRGGVGGVGMITDLNKNEQQYTAIILILRDDKLTMVQLPVSKGHKCPIMWGRTEQRKICFASVLVLLRNLWYCLIPFIFLFLTRVLTRCCCHRHRDNISRFV